MNILELLKPSDKPALIQGEKSVSYSELLDSGLSFGKCLREKGIGEKSHVLIFVPLSMDLYIAMIGAWSIGAKAIFIDFSKGAKFVADSVERLKPDIIICDTVTSLMKCIYPKMRNIKAIHIKRRSTPVTIEKVDSTHPAILTFTSGTTGVPKIAVRTHGFLINQYNVLREHLDFNENHIDLGTLPVFTLANLASHITTLLPDKSYTSKIDAAKLANQVNREGVTRIICSPALMANLLTHNDLPSLKNAYLGGGPVYPSVLEKIRTDVDLHIVYGSTEAEPISSVRWADVSENDKLKIINGEGLPAGEVVPQVECKISENQEILVSGDTVLKGYLDGIGDAENKIREGDKIWHKTGDAGYIDEHGKLWLLGRVEQAIRDAHGVLYPFCVECYLDAHFGIRGAILSKNNERIVIIEKNVARPEKILEKLNSMHISRVIEIKKLPMDKRHSAKIDYGKLKDMV